MTPKVTKGNVHICPSEQFTPSISHPPLLEDKYRWGIIAASGPLHSSETESKLTPWRHNSTHPSSYFCKPRVLLFIDRTANFFLKALVPS
jgi:hypothetical protein